MSDVDIKMECSENGIDLVQRSRRGSKHEFQNNPTVKIKGSTGKTYNLSQKA